MEPEKAFRIYNYALGRIQEERIFQRWIHGYQFSMEFEEFKRKAMGGAGEVALVQQKMQTEEEILEKVKGIIGGGCHGNL